MPSTVTIKDVASAAGVSQATAARALNGYGSVSSTAKGRVMDAARELGYETNYIAQALRSGGTRAVTFLPGSIETPFFARMARDLSSSLEAAGYMLVVSSSYESVEREQAIVETIRRQMCRGAIVAPAHTETHGHLKRLHDGGIAVVAIDRSLAAEGIDSVTVDNFALGADAARHLVERGHRTVGIIVDSEDIATTAERQRGVMETVRAAGGTSVPVLAGTAAGTAVSRVRRTLTGAGRPSAVIAVDAQTTEAALFAARESGLHIPSDLSIVGVDDHPYARLLDPPLTVMAQPVDRISEEAGALMINRLSGHAPEHVVDVQHRAALIVRGSTAPVES